MFCLLWREQGDTERCRGRQSQAGQLERHLRGCAVTRWGLLGVGVVCSFQGHLPNLTPAPILSSVCLPSLSKTLAKSVYQESLHA